MGSKMLDGNTAALRDYEARMDELFEDAETYGEEAEAKVRERLLTEGMTPSEVDHYLTTPAAARAIDEEIGALATYADDRDTDARIDDYRDAQLINSEE